MPAWVASPDGLVLWMNDRARSLLGLGREDVRGRPCHELVAALDEGGRSFCADGCPWRAALVAGRDLEPATAKLSVHGGRWIRMLPIAVRDPEGAGTCLVHCVLDVDSAHRAELFLARVEHRSPGVTVDVRNDDIAETLTPREREVLRLLLEDESLHGIAAQLHVSYATVRNHVHHILRKSGTHTILEVVARMLLHRTDS